MKAKKTAKVVDYIKRDKTILDHMGLVKVIAVLISEAIPCHIDLEDLTAAGVLGLFDAAVKFDKSRNVSFGSYAKFRIRGAILDSLRGLDWASRDMRRRMKLVEMTTYALASELQRQPTEQEIMARLGVSEERWRVMMLELKTVGLLSASTRGERADDLPSPEFPCQKARPDKLYEDVEMANLIKMASDKLPIRYQRLLTMYYVNQWTMHDIGKLLGVNESRVSQMHKSALTKMRASLEEKGIHSVNDIIRSEGKSNAAMVGRS